MRRWPAPRRRTVLSAALALGIIAAALAFRLRIVDDWRAPAGDGLQYYALSQSLIASHRLAFGARMPLSFSRLPGYPLFLAAVVHQAPTALEQHLVAAAHANVWLDLGTALLVFGLVRRRRLGLGPATAAFVAVIACPMLVFLSCYGLSESLATFLTTLALYCALGDGRRWAIAAGAAFGLVQLVRIDGLTVLPALLLALGFGATCWPERLWRGALFAVAALLVFAPWPLRNLERFGAPHFEGTAWVRQDGQPLPFGMMRWMLTWASGAAGEDFGALQVANDAFLQPERGGTLLPAMYDSAPEKAEVVALFDRYDHGGLTPAVDAAFRRLAAARRKRSRWRYYVTLPLRRLAAEWRPMPEWELPVRSSLLHLPEARSAYDAFERVLFGLALLGAALLARRDGRFVLVIITVVAARAALPALAHPFPVERYLVESFPALLALTGAGVALPLAAARARWLRRRVPAAEHA